MKAAELREKTEDELQDELVRLKRTSFNLRFRRANGTFENTAEMRQVRRDTARVLTVIREQRAVAKAPQEG